MVLAVCGGGVCISSSGHPNSGILFPRRRRSLRTMQLKQAISLALTRWPAAVCWLLVGAGFFCAGCDSGGSSPAGSERSDSRVQRALAVFFEEFVSEHGGRAPKDDAEFRSFLATKSERLAAGGIDVDRLLTSPKSGAPWVIVCGTSGPLTVDGRQVIAYESTRSTANERSLTSAAVSNRSTTPS